MSVLDRIVGPRRPGDSNGHLAADAVRNPPVLGDIAVETRAHDVATRLRERLDLIENRADLFLVRIT